MLDTNLSAGGGAVMKRRSFFQLLAGVPLASVVSLSDSPVQHHAPSLAPVFTGLLWRVALTYERGPRPRLLPFSTYHFVGGWRSVDEPVVIGAAVLLDGEESVRVITGATEVADQTKTILFTGGVPAADVILCAGDTLTILPPDITFGA